jgi:hypothetical protein
MIVPVTSVSVVSAHVCVCVGHILHVVYVGDSSLMLWSRVVQLR